MRFSLVRAFLAVSIPCAALACSTAVPSEPAGERGSPVVAPPASPSSSSGNSDKTPPKPPIGKSDAGAPSAACVETCTRSIGEKCRDDDGLCEYLCEEDAEAFIACLAAAPACEKADWNACEDQMKRNAEK